MPELRGALAALYTCTDREVVVEGRAGTAKTTGACTILLDRAKRYPRSRQLIVRETRASLTESVLVTFEKLLGEADPEVVRVNREHRHSYRLWGGSEIVTGGLDRPDRLFSTEWDTVYVPEATETSLEAWELFGRAMRNNKTPFPQRIADCNPNAPSHWINQRATRASDRLRDVRSRADYDRLQAYNHGAQTGAMRRLIGVHQDNPGYWDMAKWEWTPEGLSALAGLQSMTGHRRARMLQGLWQAQEGVVLPEFAEPQHVVAPFAIPDHWPIYVGWDPGYDHPTAILWLAIADNETIYVIDEVYQGGKSVAEHCRTVHARNEGRTVLRYYADPQHAFSRTAQSPEPIAAQAAKCGIRMMPWPRSTDVEAMVETVRRRLIDGKLKVFSTCANTIAEFQTWRYKRTAKGELPSGDDAFVDADNHAMDVVKGMCAIGLKHARGKTVVVEGR